MGHSSKYMQVFPASRVWLPEGSQLSDSTGHFKDSEVTTQRPSVVHDDGSEFAVAPAIWLEEHLEKKLIFQSIESLVPKPHLWVGFLALIRPIEVGVSPTMTSCSSTRGLSSASRTCGAHLRVSSKFLAELIEEKISAKQEKKQTLPQYATIICRILLSFFELAQFLAIISGCQVIGVTNMN